MFNFHENNKKKQTGTGLVPDRETDRDGVWWPFARERATKLRPYLAPIWHE